ncbi:MAG: helix-turn-helix transcriptional regulator [Alteromonadaceae bacterium]|nr:helix-turn-helix transcriptional regulator [Alteromonadaceae bacterium]
MNVDPSLLIDQAQEVAAILKQLSNKYRLIILCTLADKELSVGELNEKVPLSQSALSQHLGKLREAHLVETRRESQTIYYRVEDVKVRALLKALYDNYCVFEEG